MYVNYHRASDFDSTFCSKEVAASHLGSEKFRDRLFYESHCQGV